MTDGRRPSRMMMDSSGHGSPGPFDELVETFPEGFVADPEGVPPPVLGPAGPDPRRALPAEHSGLISRKCAGEVRATIKNFMLVATSHHEFLDTCYPSEQLSEQPWRNS